MAYNRTTWVSRTTPLSAANMNNIEDGIVEAKAAANGNETMWTYIRNKISSVLNLTATQYNGNAATATNADTVNFHTVQTDVPSNAVFTDTNTWNANSKSVAGYVAAPGAVSNKVWKTDSSGNPAWRDDANTTYVDATTSAHGLMSAADKTKLNGINPMANYVRVDKYTLNATLPGDEKNTYTLTNTSNSNWIGIAYAYTNGSRTVKILGTNIVDNKTAEVILLNEDALHESVTVVVGLLAV